MAEARVSGGSYAGRPGWWLRPCQGLSVTLAHFVPNQSDGSGEDADKERQGRSCVVCPASCFRSSVAEDGRITMVIVVVCLDRVVIAASSLTFGFVFPVMF